MHKPLLVAACVMLALVAVGANTASAQQAPQTRYVTVTSFDVPYGPDRGKVISFVNEYFLPATQLNPKVLNSRMLVHNWGSDAAQIVMMAEYANWADIEADCGKPCDDYYAQHPNIEEGQPGYAEFQEKAALFNKAFSTHHDEIYVVGMNRSVVEGKRPSLVGPAPANN